MFCNLLQVFLSTFAQPLPAWMGRARRNQRDAIRKQRAAKRRKRNPNGDDGSDSDGDVGYACPRNELALGSAASAGASKNSNTKRGNPEAEGEEGGLSSAVVDGNKQFNSKESTESNTSESEANSQSATKDSTTTAASATAAKKPVDKIERMRLKKREREARRKEKKAAKAQAAASGASSPK